MTAISTFLYCFLIFQSSVCLIITICYTLDTDRATFCSIWDPLFFCVLVDLQFCHLIISRITFKIYLNLGRSLLVSMLISFYLSEFSLDLLLIIVSKFHFWRFSLIFMFRTLTSWLVLRVHYILYVLSCLIKYFFQCVCFYCSKCSAIVKMKPFQYNVSKPQGQLTTDWTVYQWESDARIFQLIVTITTR